MITGYFTVTGLPYVKGSLSLPRLGVAGQVDFLVDTGATTTVLHPDDGIALGCPFDNLVLPAPLEGVGGTHTYYRETAVIAFDDDDTDVEFRLELSIAKPHPVVDGLNSLLGGTY